MDFVLSYISAATEDAWPASSEPKQPKNDPNSFQPVVTDRQLECLTWVQEGKSASDIGGILGISGRTVEGHLQKVCEQFGVRTRVQAVLKARDLGLIGSRP